MRVSCHHLFNGEGLTGSVWRQRREHIRAPTGDDSWVGTWWHAMCLKSPVETQKYFSHTSCSETSDLRLSAATDWEHLWHVVWIDSILSQFSHYRFDVLISSWRLLCSQIFTLGLWIKQSTLNIKKNLFTLAQLRLCKHMITDYINFSAILNIWLSWWQCRIQWIRPQSYKPTDCTATIW